MEPLELSRAREDDARGNGPPRYRSKWHATRCDGPPGLPHLAQRRRLDAAALLGVRAARMEVAAGRRVDRRRHVALDHLEPPPLARIGHRHRRQQHARVGMARLQVDLVGVAEFDDATEIHHRDAVGDVLHHREIVGDEEIGQPELALEIEQQVEDLALDRDVERGDRLVAQHQLRTQRDRAGDADALALAAGELEREALGGARRQADRLEQPRHPLAPLGARCRDRG